MSFVVYALEIYLMYNLNLNSRAIIPHIQSEFNNFNRLIKWQLKILGESTLIVIGDLKDNP